MPVLIRNVLDHIRLFILCSAQHKFIDPYMLHKEKQGSVLLKRETVLIGFNRMSISVFCVLSQRLCILLFHYCHVYKETKAKRKQHNGGM